VSRDLRLRVWPAHHPRSVMLHQKHVNNDRSETGRVVS
jgi:hypothetical protein